MKSIVTLVRQKMYTFLSVVILLILWFLIIDIGEHTIIKFGSLIALSLVLGAIVIAIFKMTSLSHLIFKDDLGMAFIIYLFVVTMIGVIFLVTNYVSFGKDTAKYVFKLEQKAVVTNKRGRKILRAKIRFKEQTKNIEFSNHQLNEFQSADSIFLEMRKGNLGFWVFEDYTFISKQK
ncbi:MAG: hypothetical protein AAF806_12375 [Bacteroidota bacterium]